MSASRPSTSGWRGISQARFAASQVRHDSPGVERFGLAVLPEGDRLWLDEPSRLV
ncbi:hypothetical protein [Actinomadura darangshiensis]|uniref:hypothetical protein n=1 Tax=Actinomadura darangshiensis TaxID=705336 RepID=UPI001407D42C